jgi:hypothetical protein
MITKKAVAAAKRSEFLSRHHQYEVQLGNQKKRVNHLVLGVLCAAAFCL